MGNALRSIGRFEEALAALDRAAQIYQPLGDERGLAAVAASRGSTFVSRSRFSEAMAAYDEAAKVFERIGDDRALAGVSVNRANVLWALSRYEQALAAYDQAARVFERLGDESGLAATMVGGGNCLLSVSRFEEALLAYDRAAAISERLGEGSRLADIAKNRGNALWNLNRHDEALTEYARAAQFYERIGDEGRVASIAQNRGNVFNSLGRFEEALAAYDQAAQVLERLGDDRRVGEIVANRGAVLQFLGRHEEALAAQDKALQVFEWVGDDRRVAVTALNRGGLLASLGRYDEALAALSTAAKHFDGLKDEQSLGRVAMNQGNVYWSLDRNEEALVAFERAAATFTQMGDESGMADASLNRGNVLLSLGRHDDALAAYDLAQSLYERLRSDWRAGWAAWRRGVVLAARHDHAPALRAFRDCATRVSRVLRTQVQTLGDASSTAFRASFADVVAATMQSCSEVAEKDASSLADSYFVLQTFHAFGLAEMMADCGSLRASSLSEELRQEFVDAQSRWLQAMAHRDASQIGGAPEERAQKMAARDAALADVRAREQDLERVIERARLRHRSHMDVRYPRAASVEEVQAELAPGSALVEYVLGDDQAFAIVTTRERAMLVPLGNAEPITRMAAGLATTIALRAQSPSATELRALGERVLDPVLAACPERTRSLLFSPHGALCRVPLELLLTGEPPVDASCASWPYLVSSHDVAYVHSGTVLVAMRKDARERERPGGGLAFYGLAHPYDAEAEGKAHDAAKARLAFLDAERGKAREPLRATVDEVLDIASLFAANDQDRAAIAHSRALFAKDDLAPSKEPVAGSRFRVLLRECADEHALKSDPAIKTAHIVHLACHGEADTTSPQLSRLVLARAASIEEKTGEDGYFYVRDLRDLDINCELLVLSACESTPGKLSAVEGMTGLARAGLAGGAEAVVSTLWQVRDADARQLMVSFYEHLLGSNSSRIRALSDAKRKAIERGMPARTWSAYVLWDAATAQ
jgi:tetratricopeptide (TPR) repeat protein